MTRAARARGTRDGYILVAVLGVMLLLTAFMAGGSLLVRSALNSIKVGDDDVAVIGLTQGGMELTAYQLFVLKLPMSLVDGRRIRLAGGTIVPSIVDEAGKVDLNGSDPNLLRSIFQAVGLDAGTAGAIVARIVAIRGATRGPSAAAQAPPGSTAPPAYGYQPGAAAPPQSGEQKQLRGFLALDDLALFPDLTRDDRRTLDQILTVYNPDGKVDILTASPEVLGAIPGLSKAALAEILARRDGMTKDTVYALQAQLGAASTYTKTTSGPAYTVRIDAAAPSGRKKSIAAVVAASKSPNDPYYILDWRN